MPNAILTGRMYTDAMRKIDITYDQIKELLASGLTKQQVADRLKVNEKTVYNKCVQQSGLSVRDVATEQRRIDSASGEYTVRQLAKKYGVSTRGTKEYLRRHGYEARQSDADAVESLQRKYVMFTGRLLRSKPCAGMKTDYGKRSITFCNRLTLILGRDCITVISGNETEIHSSQSIHTRIGLHTVNIQRCVGATISVVVGANKLLFSFERKWSVEVVSYTR